MKFAFIGRLRAAMAELSNSEEEQVASGGRACTSNSQCLFGTCVPGVQICD